jgi:valyl-tRNA synthetase
VLTETVALAHPVIPFVTEEIYAHIPGAEGLLAARVSTAAAGTVDPAAEAAITELIAAVQAVRGWRDAAEVKPSVVVPARLEASGYEHTTAQLAQLARLEFSAGGDSNGNTNGNGDGKVNGNGTSGERGEAGAVVPIPGGTVAVLASEQVDTEAATRKLAAKRKQIESDIARAEGKLANQGFVAKAPPAVVEAEREKLAKLRAELEALDDA